MFLKVILCDGGDGRNVVEEKVVFNEEWEEKLCIGDIWEVGVSVGCPNVWSDYFVVEFWYFGESCVGVAY